MSQIRVHVSAPGEVPVPNTGVFTHPTSYSSSNENTYYIGLCIVIAIILAVILPVFFIRKWKNTNHSVREIVPRLLLLAALSFGLTFSALLFADGSNKDAVASDQNNLTVTAEDVDIYVELKDKPVYVEFPATVTVNDSVVGGYTLSVYTDTLDLISEENVENRISGISPEADTLDENTWGISLSGPENQNTTTWKALPTEDNALIIKNTEENTPANDNTKVYYGVYITPDTPYGIYIGSVNYVAVANVVDPGFFVSYNTEEGYYFDEEGTINTNIVRYAKHCEEDGSCYWYRARGEYREPIMNSEYEPAVWHTEIADFQNEEELLALLNTAGDQADILLDATIDTFWNVEEEPSFYIEYDGNGYYFDDGETMAYNIVRYAKHCEEDNSCYWYRAQGIYREPIMQNDLESTKWETGINDFQNETELLALLQMVGDEADALIGYTFNASWHVQQDPSFIVYYYSDGYYFDNDETLNIVRYAKHCEEDDACHWYRAQGSYKEPIVHGGSYNTSWYSDSGEVKNETELLTLLSAAGDEADQLIGNTIEAYWRVEKTIETLIYMQEFNTLTEREMDVVLDSMEEDQQYQLRDIRDEKTYYIAKLKDGNVWMTQNLDLDLDSARTYTPDDTDIPSDWSPSKSTCIVSNAPENCNTGSYDVGDLYWNGSLNTSNESTSEGYITTDGNPHFHLGNYYSFPTAIANHAYYLPRGTTVNQSICPAGWTLPHAGYGEDSYYALINQYDTWDKESYTLLNNTKVWETPMFFFLNGGFYNSNNSIDHVGRSSGYWSSTINPPNYMFVLRFFSNGIILREVNDGGMVPEFEDHGYGEAVRCVARPISTSTTLEAPMTINDLTYMQEFNTLTEEHKEQIFNSMNEDEQYQLKDIRDEKTYYIAKLKDGNVWMTQNLDLDLDATKTYTPDDTDIPNNWTPVSSTYPANSSTWVSSTTTLESYDPGNYLWNRIILEYQDDTPVGDRITESGDFHYHLGNYYNWTAAVAMNDSSSYAHIMNASRSICPAGWKLPSHDNNNYELLTSEYGFSNSIHNENVFVYSEPMFFILSGYYNGVLRQIGREGQYFENWVNSGNCGFMNVINNSTWTQSMSGRENGRSVRCLVNPL